MDSLWSQYSSEESFLPFYIPSIFWWSLYGYCKWNKIDFARWFLLHNIHNFCAIAMGLVVLYDDTLLSERIGILWSIAYFVVDIVDRVTEGDFVYSLHGIFCLGLGICNYTVPVCRELHMNSKAVLLECSNPLMHLARTTRNPLHFAAFAVVFTFCRIIWMPIMSYQLYQAGRDYTDPLQMGLLSFYALNVFWYYKILKILYQGASGEAAKKEK